MSDNQDAKTQHEIGIKMLRDRREKITNGGKYSDRYKNTFSHEVKDEKYPLSTKCRETLEQYRTLSKQSDKSDSSTLSARHSPSFTKEMMGTPKAMPSNATNDLNKQENTLISYKPISDTSPRLPLTSTVNTSPKQLKYPKKSNVYSITPAADNSKNLPQPPKIALKVILNNPNPGPSDNTQTHLDDVESIISKLKEKEKKEENMRKFNELVAKARKERVAVPANVTPAKKPPPVDQSQDLLKPQKALMNPIKPSKEIEDLQASRGFSDVDTDNEEHQFNRHIKERKSMDQQGTREIKREENKTTSLNRTASDVQDKNVVMLKRKPRMSRDRNKVISFNLWYNAQEDDVGCFGKKHSPCSLAFDLPIVLHRVSFCYWSVINYKCQYGKV